MQYNFAAAFKMMDSYAPKRNLVYHFQAGLKRLSRVLGDTGK